MPVLSIKLGTLEVSYDGDQTYIEQGLMTLLRELADLGPAAASPAAGPKGAAPSAQERTAGPFGHTTSQIAAMMTIKSGSDLAQAAAAHLVLVKGQETFTRSELYDEMKGASSYVTASYLKNLTPTLAFTVKSKRFTPVSKDKYSLPASVRKEFQAKLSHE